MAKFDLLRRHGGVAGLKQALVGNDGLLGEVRGEIAALKGIHQERCVVTAEYRDALQRAVDGMG